MKPTTILLAFSALLSGASNANAAEISRELPAFALPSIQFKNLKAEISESAHLADLPHPTAVSKKTFRDEYDFLSIAQEGNLFSPLSDLKKLKVIIKSLPDYLDRANLDFESHRHVLETISIGEHNLDAMLLKYTAGTRTTRANFLIEAGPAIQSFENTFRALKGNQDGGSHNDNCWSSCVEDCDPTDLGGIVCHLSCYYTCETNKP